MFNHEPPKYTCPFCRLLAGVETEHNRQDDIVLQNEFITAFVAPKWWNKNKGSVLIVANKHYENIYDIHDEVLAEAYKAVKQLSIAIRKTYDCDGTSTRQHNEPAGDQDVWHFHAHVFPRYEGDDLYKNNDNRGFVTPEARVPYVKKLRDFIDKQL
jgi:histidine triad (HIT) family protein